MAEATVRQWRRFGHDRLYVNQRDGVELGWFDLGSEAAHPARPEHLDTLLEAVARWRAPDEEPTQEADAGDLAAHVPGQMARQQAESVRAAAPKRALLGRLLGVHTEERAWRVGAKGEEKTGKRLQALIKRDPRWRALHSVPVGDRGSDIDHLVIGPGGVFTINSKHHPRGRVWVAGDTVMVNGRRVPYVRNARHEAQRVERTLTGLIGKPVPVTPVIALIGVRNLDVKQPNTDVRIWYREALVRRLRKESVVLDEPTCLALYELARQPATWQP